MLPEPHNLLLFAQLSRLLPQFVNMLSWWQWAILLAVPPAIILLYFLKLKRYPLEVPSTYLWHRSIEDLHVNAIWQRLRRNLLLFLQLLLIFLAMLAVLRPGWRGTKVSGDRFILLVDNSASMQATDAGPSRLEEAKRQAGELVGQLSSRDAGMIISFSNFPQIEQMFTRNRRQLRQGLEGIEPTARPTSLAEALKYAAGLANPGRSSEDASDVQVADPMPATLYIFSDGKFAEVSDFRLGNLDPVYMPVGSDDAANVGILAFSVRRHVSDRTLLQAFARLGNFGPQDASVTVELRLNGKLVDADQVQIPSGEPQRVAFDLTVVDTGVIQLRIATRDDLACDDVAWAVVNPPRRSKVLLVTPGNESLEIAFATDAVRELADVTVESPEFLDQPPYEEQASAGVFDLIVYDRTSPKVMPQANTLFMGALPSSGGDEQTGEKPKEDAGEKPAETEREEEAPAPGVWRAGPTITSATTIIDTNSTHPLMQWIDMGDVTLYHPTPLELPPGGTSLIDVQWIGTDKTSHVAPVFVIAPREGFEDAVMGFAFLGEEMADDGTRQTYIGTNWPIRESFPVFVLNFVHYLGGAGTAGDGATVKPGEPVALESPMPGTPLDVRTPSGETVKLEETAPGRFQFAGTSELGVYEVRSGEHRIERFAVNLFDGPESDIRPSPEVQIGRGTPVAAQETSSETTRRELWKWLLLAGLAVLVVEWYIYNRRVYL